MESIVRNEHQEEEQLESCSEVNVDLSQRYIDVLPASFFVGENAIYQDHRLITSLNLAHNQFIQFPSLICSFTNLRRCEQ